MLEATNFTHKQPAVPCMMTDFYGNQPGENMWKGVEGKKKNTQNGKKPLMRVNGLTCPESQSFLTSGTGHFTSRTAPSLHASAHATGETMSQCPPKPGAGSALLSAPLGRQPAAVSGVPSALVGGWGRLWLLAQQALSCKSGLARKLAGVPPTWEPCFWLGMPKDSLRHGVGAGRHVQGLGSVYEFVWDRKVAVGEGMESGWTWLGVRVGGTRMERGGQDKLHPEVWPEAGSWSLLLEVSAVSLHLGAYCCQWWHSNKLTLGTSDLGRYSPPAGPEPKPPSSRSPEAPEAQDVSKLQI